MTTAPAAANHPPASPSSIVDPHTADEHHHPMPTGWRRWLLATNHKDIGSMYLLFSLTMLMVGGVLALLIRAELFYIMILPAFGIISQVVPAFSRKRLFGYTSMVYATASIAILSFIVWAHHMFTTGMPVTGQLFFMYATMLVAVPTAVKVFNWIATMWQGSISMETPILFAAGFIFVFSVGGLSGVMLAVSPIDIQVHDTHFVVAHFHYVLVAGSLFAMFAGYYYWAPKWTGVMYSEVRGRIHFCASILSFNIAFFPLHFWASPVCRGATLTTLCSLPISTSWPASAPSPSVSRRRISPCSWCCPPCASAV